MIKKNDIILISAILLLALLATLFIALTKSDGSKVVITVDGEIRETLDLNVDQIFTIEGENGSINVMEIKDGSVIMSQADCSDKLCVKHRSIHYNHESIVCLPNKVVLEIVDGEEGELDMIAN